MKRSKKVIISLLLLLCFTGVVQASSINGDYEGNPIVKVSSGGKELQVEDVPAMITGGRTLVPLYLLRQSGVSVAWDAEKYSVDLTLPDPVKDFSAKLKSFNVEAKTHNAKNVQLIYNEYGPYLSVDLELASDSNKDNENIIFLSSLVAQSPADMLIVKKIHNNRIMGGYVIINRTDAEEFIKKKTSDYEFIKKWRFQIVSDLTDISMEINIPPAAPTPTPTPSTSGGPACLQITAAYSAQMRDAAETHNASDSKDPNGVQQVINKLQSAMNEALKTNHCSEH